MPSAVSRADNNLEFPIALAQKQHMREQKNLGNKNAFAVEDFGPSIRSFELNRYVKQREDLLS